MDVINFFSAAQNESLAPPQDENKTKITKKETENQQVLTLAKRITAFITTVVAALCIASIILEIWSIYDIREGIIYAAGIVGLIVAPSVMVKQFILLRTDSLRSAHNKIRMEINRFMEENNILHRNVDALEVQTGRLQQFEGELQKVTGDAEVNVDELIHTVKENEKYIKRLDELAREEFQQHLVTTILKSDRDGDGKVEDREIRILIARFKGKRGLNFDDKKLHASIENSDGSIKSIMDILKDLNVESS